MKFSELKNKKEGELKKMLEESRKKVRSLRFELARGKVKNPKEIQKNKRIIAKILTLLCQKED